MNKILLKALLLLLLPLGAQGRDADSLRVLWVGNSYTYYNDMPATVQRIAATQNVKLSCTRTLDSLVHAASPDARVIFYMTWGHKNGNRKFIPEYPPVNDYATMQERLITSYLEMAYDNDAWCAPVGMAWRRVRAERPDYVLYAQDCFHPAPLGSYLAANVIFTTIYGKPYQTDCTMGFPAEQAEYIQRIAQQTVLENSVLLNIER